MASSAFGHHQGLWVITNIADDVVLPSSVIPPKHHFKLAILHSIKTQYTIMLSVPQCHSTYEHHAIKMPYVHELGKSALMSTFGLVLWGYREPILLLPRLTDFSSLGFFLWAYLQHIQMWSVPRLLMISCCMQVYCSMHCRKSCNSLWMVSKWMALFSRF